MARRYGWSGMLVWLVAFGASAAGPTPGEYGTKQGWGGLQVSDKGGARHFEILAVGANGHTCSLEGTLQGDKAEVRDASDTPCKLAFKPVAGGFSIAALTQDSCRDYCGMRASFEGDYLKLPAGCTHPERRQPARRSAQRQCRRGGHAHRQRQRHRRARRLQRARPGSGQQSLAAGQRPRRRRPLAAPAQRRRPAAERPAQRRHQLVAGRCRHPPARRQFDHRRPAQR